MKAVRGARDEVLPDAFGSPKRSRPRRCMLFLRLANAFIGRGISLPSANRSNWRRAASTPLGHEFEPKNVEALVVVAGRIPVQGATRDGAGSDKRRNSSLAVSPLFEI